MILQSNSINMDDLPKLAKSSPQYTSMFGGLYQIDSWVKKLVTDIIDNTVDNVSTYYIKTALEGQCYSLYLFNTERQVTVGVSWPLVTFLQLCEAKALEIEITPKVKQMLRKFKETNLLKDKTNWVN